MEMEIGMNDGTTMDVTSLTDTSSGNVSDPQLPDQSVLNQELRDFLSEGYIMSADCFGSSSTQYADRLMEFVNDEYSDHLYYQTLSRKAAASGTRKLFKSIAADELLHSKRFAAAYFLITGKRYFPTRTSIEPVVVPASYIQALRDRYLAESRDAVKYRTFAQQTSDRCLKRIAEATSNDEKQHAQDILELIQKM
jgi:rubrerythrin